MAADDQGNIGYWHPGLLQLKPRGWDERLPYPGTGEAEWRGFLPPNRRPQVVNPQAGLPVRTGTTCRRPAGRRATRPARERLTGRFHRGGVARSARCKAAHRRGGGYEQSARVDRLTGHDRAAAPAGDARAASARRADATGDAAHACSTTILRLERLVPPDRRGRHGRPGRRGLGGVQDGRAAGRARALRRRGASCSTAARASSHAFDASNGDAYALRTLDAARLPPGGEAGASAACRSGSARATRPSGASRGGCTSRRRRARARSPSRSRSSTAGRSSTTPSWAP